MSRRKLNMTAHERVLRTLRRKHEGWTDYIDEVEPYVREHPEDRTTAGQLRYAKQEVERLAAIIAQHENREAVKHD